MFTSLSEFLNFSNSLPEDLFIVAHHIESSKCPSVDGCFILHHFISQFLKENSPVCIIGLAQTLNHYSHIGNKLGCSFSVSKTNNQLLFIEALDLIGNCVGCAGECDSNQQWFSLIDSKNQVDQLYIHLRHVLLEHSKYNAKPLLFVIDDLTILLSLGCSFPDLVFLVHSLKSFIKSLGGTLLIRVNLNNESEDHEANLLSKQLLHFSDLNIKTKGLTSGFSKDVNGEIQVEYKREMMGCMPSNQKKKIQFKVTDKNLTLFHSGLSTAVL